MSEVKICTYKQVDRVLSNIQKEITDLRKDKNIYQNKTFGFVKFPNINPKHIDLYKNRTLFTDFEKGQYFGVLEGLKYARQIIGNYRDNFSSYVSEYEDREMKKLMPDDYMLVRNYLNDLVYKESTEKNILSTNSKTTENISTTKVKLKKINNKRKTVRKHKSCKCKRGK
jgi:hypothetical protein